MSLLLKMSLKLIVNDSVLTVPYSMYNKFDLDSLSTTSTALPFPSSTTTEDRLKLVPSAEFAASRKLL